MSTLEEVRKAYEDLSDDDKKTFSQSIADRVHESVAAQEEDSGKEDSQSAEAREHEALGAEHAAGKGDTEELRKADDTAEEKHEDAQDAKHDALEERLSRLEAAIEELRVGKEAPAPAPETDKLEESRQRYGLAPTAGKQDEVDEISPADAMKKLKNA